MPEITLRDLYLARRRISGIARRTPLLHNPALSERCGAAVYLKAECLQETGSFKIRGAANRMAMLSPEERARGVITVSSGNHGRAVATVARRLGIQAVVCLSEAVPANKVEAIRRLGAEAVVRGAGYDDAVVHSEQLERERSLTRIDPFDDPEVIAGQGTIGLELLEDLPDIDTALIPLSGGGLAGGISLALKAADPAIRCIGVSMERAPVMAASLQAGHPVVLPEEPTIADALAGGLGTTNRYTFPLCQQVLDDTALVSEAEIEDAMVFALREHHLVLEGGGAVALAALLFAKVRPLGHNVVIVLSGANVPPELLARVAARGAEARDVIHG